MAVLVVVTTAVMAVMDQVDPRLDCCARRSSHCRVQSHEPERGLVVGSVVVVAIGEEVIVGCSCRVVMGVIQKGLYQQKRLHGSLFLAPLPPSKLWKVLCTHHNELFRATSECAPLANIPYWGAPIANIR